MLLICSGLFYGCGDDDGEEVDAGRDAGEIEEDDAGPDEDDAGPDEDDAGPDEDDAGPGDDDAGTGGFMAVGGCDNEAAYVTGDEVAISPTTTVYDPRCLRVSEDDEVTIGASDFHPLIRSSGGTAGSPISATAVMAPAVLTFSEPGFYPFHCTRHGSDGGGMRGVIWVE